MNDSVSKSAAFLLLSNHIILQNFDAKVYMAVEGFEESLGLDPNDPLVPFVLFLGLSVTLWYKPCFVILFLFLILS